MSDNLNISPDMINNLVNMLSNNPSFQNYSNDKENSKESENLKNSNNTNATNTANNIDFETIMKLKSVMDNMNNSNNQDSRLLYSLKPYLRKSRQEKLDQYINILKISHVSKLFNQKGDGT